MNRTFSVILHIYILWFNPKRRTDRLLFITRCIVEIALLFLMSQELNVYLKFFRLTDRRVSLVGLLELSGLCVAHHLTSVWDPCSRFYLKFFSYWKKLLLWSFLCISLLFATTSLTDKIFTTVIYLFIFNFSFFSSLVLYSCPPHGPG